MKKPVVHLAKALGMCSIHTYCGAAMQRLIDGWTSEVNYWGKIGIRKHTPIEVLAFDPTHATCPACLKEASK